MSGEGGREEAVDGLLQTGRVVAQEPAVAHVELADTGWPAQAQHQIACAQVRIAAQAQSVVGAVEGRALAVEIEEIRAAGQ